MPRDAASPESAKARRSGSITPRNAPGVWMPERDWSETTTRAGAPSIRVVGARPDVLVRDRRRDLRRGEGPGEDVDRERRLAAARDAAQPRDDAERDRDILAARGCCAVGWRTTSSPVGRPPRSTARGRSRARARPPPARSRCRLAATTAAGPDASSRPPSSPAPGPRTTSRSARPTSSGSWSTSTTVLPASRARPSASPSASTSRGWRPRVGSSRSTVTPVSSAPAATRA